MNIAQQMQHEKHGHTRELISDSTPAYECHNLLLFQSASILSGQEKNAAYDMLYSTIPRKKRKQKINSQYFYLFQGLQQHSMKIKIQVSCGHIPPQFQGRKVSSVLIELKLTLFNSERSVGSNSILLKYLQKLRPLVVKPIVQLNISSVLKSIARG